MLLGQDGVVRFRPVSPERLVAELADMIADCSPDRRLAVIIDGAPPAGPGRWSDAVVDPVRVRGRPVLRVSAADFVRPASLRYERGRTNPAARYDDWLDLPGLAREVFARWNGAPLLRSAGPSRPSPATTARSTHQPSPTS